jgi:hypothetical protein
MKKDNRRFRRLSFLPGALGHTIFQFLHSVLACTMGAAVKFSVAHLHAVPDDLTSAVRALWSKCMDGAFETVEDMSLTTEHHFK